MGWLTCNSDLDDCLGYVDGVGHHAIPRARLRICTMQKEHGIPWSLCLNYDQTWVNAYRAPVRALRRKRRKGMPNTVRVSMVTGSREGVSYCASSWGDGTPGPLFISVGARSLSETWLDSCSHLSYVVELIGWVVFKLY